MRLLKIENFKNSIFGIISEKHQLSTYHVELTVQKIFAVTSPGALDFGGSEYLSANLSELQPRKREGEKYGWWQLPAGIYLLEMNESIDTDEDVIGIISTLPRLIEAGGYVQNITLSAEELKRIKVLLVSPLSGLKIKENARLLKLILYSIEK